MSIYNGLLLLLEFHNLMASSGSKLQKLNLISKIEKNIGDEGRAYRVMCREGIIEE
jgi:hypothetical protein